MSSALPESIDARRAVAARRIYQGLVPLSRFARLRPSLFDDQGECRFRLEFFRDELGALLVELEVRADLPLECQRSLERFAYPIEIRQKLGLVRSEADEATLAPGVEPVLVAEDGVLNPLDLIEDELILALPVVPVKGDAPEPLVVESSEAETRVNPFAVLAALKQKS